MGRSIRYFGLTERIPDRREYHVWFAEFPDLETHTRKLEDVESAASRLLHREIDARLESGEALPKPRSKEDFRDSPLYRNAVLVSLDVDPKTGRVETPTNRRKS